MKTKMGTRCSAPPLAVRSEATEPEPRRPNREDEVVKAARLGCKPMKSGGAVSASIQRIQP